MGQVQRLIALAVLSLSSCGDDAERPAPPVAPAVAMEPLPPTPPPPGLVDAPKPPEPTPAPVIDAAEAQRRWVHGALRGHDNSMARMRAVTITELDGGRFSVRVANQFGFRCGLEFGADGRPARMTGCRAGEPGWSASPAVIDLECETTERDEICRGTYMLGSGGFRDPARFQLLRRLDRDERTPTDR